MATPKIIADFEAQLSTALSVGDTSFTLSSNLDDDGVALPAGLYYFTLDNGSSQKEFLAGTLSGSSVTGVLSVSRQGVETSGCVRSHRVGASVIITDFATYKKYMDEIALVSAPDATTTVKGVVEGATLAEVRAGTATGGTGAVLVATPDVLDDLPTEDEKAAMAGGGAFGTPSTTNKYLTEDWTASNSTEVVVFTGSGTWTKDTGLQYIIVEVIGGGGNGSTRTTAGAGGGGGAGAYSKKVLLASEVDATETVTVGAVAGTSSFTNNGTTVQSTGGTSVASNTVTGGAGGTATGGEVNISGQAGGIGQTVASTELGGDGASSQLGTGGISPQAVPTGSGTSYSGIAATGYGAGGSGSVRGSSGTPTGGAGSAGIVIVTEYYT
jgi:hypothetical protein